MTNNIIVNDEQSLVALVARVKEAQNIFATYTQEQVEIGRAHV